MILRAALLVSLAALASGAGVPPAEVHLGAVNWFGVPPSEGGYDIFEWGRNMQYAVHAVNEDPDVLPRTNLTMHFSDPGPVPGVAVLAGINMVTPSADGGKDAVAVIGASTSDNTVAMSQTLAALGKPLISFSSTTHELSNKQRHPFFVRTQMSAYHEAQRYFDLFDRLGWKQAALVHTADDFGRGSADAFLQAGVERGVEISTHSVPPTISNETTDEALPALHDVLSTSRRVVLVYMLREPARAFFTAAASLGMTEPEAPYQFLLGSASGGGVPSEAAVPGYPVGTVKCIPAMPSADTYAPYRDWAAGQLAFDASTHPLGPLLAPRRSVNAHDAVRAVALALHALLEVGDEAPRDPNNGTLLLAALRAVQFDGAGGPVSFDANGDAAGIDVTLQVVTALNETSGLETLEGFGSVSASSGAVSIDAMPVWGGTGSTKVPLDEPPTVTREVTSGMRAAAHAAAAVTAAAVLGTAALVAVYWRHAVIRAATPPLLQTMLAGMLLAAASVSVMALGPETSGVCFAVPAMLCGAYALVVGPLLAKTWRLNRIFNAKTMRVTKISNARLGAVVAAIVAAEVLLQAVRFATDKPEGALVPVDGTPFVDVYKCETEQPEVWWALLLAPKAAMLLAGSVLAYKVRNLRDSFNESRAIAYAMYVVFFLSLLGVPVATMSEDTPALGFAVATFSVCIGVLSLLAVLFGSKFWSILVTQSWQQGERQGTVATSIDSAKKRHSPRGTAATTSAGTSKAGGHAAGASRQKQQQQRPAALQLAPLAPGAAADPSSAPGSPLPPASAVSGAGAGAETVPPEMQA